MSEEQQNPRCISLTIDEYQRIQALEQRVQEQALILDAIYQKLKELTN